MIYLGYQINNLLQCFSTFFGSRQSTGLINLAAPLPG
jgi:hypothetical protein